MSQSQNKRQHRRVEVSMEAEVRYDGHLWAAKVRDLSEGGVGLSLRHSGHEHSVPEEVEIEVLLIVAEDGVADPAVPPLSVRAHVMWTVEQDDGRHMVGVRFSNLGTTDKLRIKEFIGSLVS